MNFKKFWYAGLISRVRDAPSRLHFERIVLLPCLLISGLAAAQTVSPDCDWPHKGSGPYDYRVAKGSFSAIENRHFPPKVEALLSGATTSAIGADIDYMLNKVPNHPRALLSLVRLGERYKSDTAPHTRGRIACYFERAMRFQPDDVIVRMIYATYLSKGGREPEALRQLEIATESAGDNPFTHNNIGLVYFDLKNYERALVQAHKAYGLGFQSPNLRDQLMRVGKWTEPAGTLANVPGKEPETPAAQSPAEQK